uniref:Uncharacterized protein n=1 Tax=Rhizophagus irregularis (strain DAOM 181602 / DAOM 197198 / MUCL 43194) TaxID=747089 RepID=U9TN09_RHIID
MIKHIKLRLGGGDIINCEVAAEGEGEFSLLTSSFRSCLTILAYETRFCLPLDVKGVAFIERPLIDSSYCAATFNWYSPSPEDFSTVQAISSSVKPKALYFLKDWQKF